MSHDDEDPFELEVTVSFIVPAEDIGTATDPHELASLTRERWIEDPDLLTEVVRGTDDFDLQVRPLFGS